MNDCRTFGTPNDASWPGVTKLRDYAPTFPKWKRKNTCELFPQIDESGLNLLEVRALFVLLAYNVLANVVLLLIVE